MVYGAHAGLGGRSANPSSTERHPFRGAFLKLAALMAAAVATKLVAVHTKVDAFSCRHLAGRVHRLMRRIDTHRIKTFLKAL